MAAEKPGRDLDGDANVEGAEKRIRDGLYRDDDTDRELPPRRTVHFNVKGSTAGKVVTGLALAAAVGGGVKTLGPAAERAGAEIAKFTDGPPESKAQDSPHGIGGPSTDQVRESVERTRAAAQAPHPGE